MKHIQLPFFYLSEVHYIRVLMSDFDIPEVPADNKAAPFEITAHTYKIVDGHSILLDIHVPKKLLEKGSSSAEWKKKHPVQLPSRRTRGKDLPNKVKTRTGE